MASVLKLLNWLIERLSRQYGKLDDDVGSPDPLPGAKKPSDAE